MFRDNYLLVANISHGFQLQKNFQKRFNRVFVQLCILYKLSFVALINHGVDELAVRKRSDSFFISSSLSLKCKNTLRPSFFWSLSILRTVSHPRMPRKHGFFVTNLKVYKLRCFCWSVKFPGILETGCNGRRNCHS